MKPEHLLALDALALALDERAEGGRRPPCRGRWSRFLSEDAEVRHAAAVDCHACPVLDPCNAVGAFETSGVWAGRDRQTSHAKGAKK